MKNRWRIFFGIIVLVLVIYALTKIDFIESYNLLKTISPNYFLLAFLAQTLGLIIVSLRGMIYLNPLFESGFWFFLKITFAGNFINAITPGTNVGGEPIKAYFLAKKYKKPKSKVFGAIFADRITHGAVGLFFIIVSILFILTYIPISRELKIIFITILFFVIFVFTVFFFLNIKKSRFDFNWFLKKIGILKRIKNKKLIKHIGDGVGNFTSYFRKTIFNRKILPYGLLLSVISSLLIFLSPYFLFLSLGFQINFFTVLMVVSLGALIGDLSPTPGGIGFVEAFMVLVYSILGINLEIAIMVSVLSRLIGYFHSLVFGGISLFYIEKELE